MNTQTIKTTHPLIIIAAIAVSVFSLVGTAAVLGWIPTSRSTPADSSLTQAVAAHQLAAGTTVDTPKPEAKAEPKPAPARPVAVHRPKPKPVAQQAVQAEPPMVIARNEPAPIAVHSEPAIRTYQAEPIAAAEPARRQCYECGTIESVRESVKPGETNGVGIGAGAVAGGVLGHQMGSGRGNDVMTVLGAIGGAFAGHQIEKKVKTVKEYRITVRFEDGTTQQVVQSTAPAWREGDKVKVVNGSLVSNG